MNAELLVHPGADPNCPICDRYGITLVRDGPYAKVAACSCLSTCPTCNGSGWIARDSSFRAPRIRCACTRMQHRGRRLEEARIPSRYVEASLANFDPSGPVGTAFIAVNSFLHSYSIETPNRGLVLWGDVGRGKTHLAVALVRELVLRYGVTARFIEFSHLLTDLKASFERRQGAASLMEELTEVDVLVVDELGKGRATEFEGSVVDELVTRRYNAAATIIATTNYAPIAPQGRATTNLALGQQQPVSLSDRVGERVYSRLREVCAFVSVEGDDHRRRRPTRR